MYSIIALHLQGYPLEHPVMAAALAGLDDFIIHDDRGRRVEACQSPVWDTALALVALADAGVDEDDPTLVSAAQWLLDEEITVTGDWAVRRPRLAPGGWAFEFANDNYPDIDDTAEVVLALRRVRGAIGARGDEACARGVAWTAGMQSRGGGWGAFDADNDSDLVAALPFCDFGRVTDPPSADVTAHVIEMLAAEPGAPPGAVERGVAWLSEQQEADGSWFGRWGVNYVYGTGAAVPALVAAGVAPHDPRIRRAVTWLQDHQNPDGGWGRTCARTSTRNGEAAAPRRHRRRRGRCWPCWPPANQATRRPGGVSSSSPPRSNRMAPGMSRGSPARDSRGTSASTITCTAWCGR